MAVNVKIHDVVANTFLAIDSQGKTLQELIPKHFFFGGHILAELLSVGDVVGIVIEWHFVDWSVGGGGVTEQIGKGKGDPHPPLRGPPSPEGKVIAGGC